MRSIYVIVDYTVNMTEILPDTEPIVQLQTPKEKIQHFFTGLGKKKVISLAALSFFILMLPIVIVAAQTRQNIRQEAAEMYDRYTVDFNDIKGRDVALNGEYPIGLIQWGKDTWNITPPWGLFTTKSLQFLKRGTKSATFQLLKPGKIVSLEAFNGGGSRTTDLSISCEGNSTVTIQVPAEKKATLTTNWTNLCTVVTLTIGNGWDTSVDTIIIDIPRTGDTTPTNSITVTPTPMLPTSTQPTTIPPTSVPTVIPTSPPSTGGIWKPALNTSWQWQLTTPVDQSLNVQMYDIDGFENSASVVTSLHAKGAKVVCYMSFGSYEDWRPDAKQFPAEVLGKSNGWPGEKWLDIRNITALAPIVRARMDLCKQKGFDAVEPDNVDGYTNNTGFPLTAQDQINYNKFLADEAHARGMSIGLKNDVDQLAALVPYFDWALNEQCFEYNECGGYTDTFIKAGKAVFNVEYSLNTSKFCTQANNLNINSLKKDLDLTASRTACR